MDMLEAWLDLLQILGLLFGKSRRRKLDIGQILPIGLDYGPGWVGEKERQQQPHSVSNKHGSVNNSVSDDHPNKTAPPSGCGSKFVAVNRSFLPIKDDMAKAESVSILNYQSNLNLLRSVGGTRPEPTCLIQQTPVIQIHSDTNGSGRVCDFDLSSGMAGRCGSEQGFMPSHLLGIVPSSNSTFVCPISGKYLKFDEPEPTENATRIHTGNLLASSPVSSTMPEVELC